MEIIYLFFLLGAKFGCNRRRCQKNRHVSETAMNDRSSRSHTIVSLKIQSKDLLEDENTSEGVAMMTSRVSDRYDHE